jgi:hypothetical protein
MSLHGGAFLPSSFPGSLLASPSQLAASPTQPAIQEATDRADQSALMMEPLWHVAVSLECRSPGEARDTGRIEGSFSPWERMEAPVLRSSSGFIERWNVVIFNLNRHHGSLASGSPMVIAI